MKKRTKEKLILGLSILLLMAIDFSSKQIWNYYNNDGGGAVPGYISFLFSLDVIFIWSYIGFKVNEFRSGIIAGLAHLGFIFINSYFNLDIYLLLPIFTSLLFAFLTGFRRKQLIWFSVMASSIIYCSHIIQNQYVFWDFIFEFVEVNYEWDNFISNYIGDLFIVFLQSIAIFTLIPMFYFQVRRKGLIELGCIDLTLSEDKKSIHFNFYVFYFIVIYASIGLGASYKDIFILDFDSWLDKVLLVIWIVFSVIFWYSCIWFYRRNILSVMSKRNWDISWYYLFLQIPILRSMIWTYVSTTLNQPTSKKSYKISHTQNDGILILIVVVFVLRSISSITGDNSDYGIIAVFISFTGLILFVLYKYGVHVLFAIQAILFFWLVYASHYSEISIPRGIITKWYFIPLAISFIQYPLFHLKEFKIMGENKDVE